MDEAAQASEAKEAKCLSEAIMAAVVTGGTIKMPPCYSVVSTTIQLGSKPLPNVQAMPIKIVLIFLLPTYH